MSIGQIFNASSKINPEGIIYRFDGTQTNEATSYNIKLTQVSNSGYILVEPEWFNQRNIKITEVTQL